MSDYADGAVPPPGLASVANAFLSCVRRVLLAGDDHAELAALLEKRGLRVTQCRMTGLPRRAVEESRRYGAVLLGDVRALAPISAEAAAAGRALIRADGALYIAAPARQHLDAFWADAGLTPYVTWRVLEDGSVRAAASGDEPSFAGQLVMAVAADYDPVLHARRLLKLNHPGWALEVLTNIPDGFFQDDERRALAAAERQLCLFAWDRAGGPEGRLERFFRAQRQFYVATTLLPRRAQPYLVQAALWRKLGDDAMAARLLRSIQHAAPTPDAAQMLGELGSVAPRDVDEAAPVWRNETSAPRVLLVSHEESDFGVDVLYDGLCRVLGPERIVDFPWKPTLHGQAPERTYGYPCLFDHPGEPLALEAVCGQVRAGAFDVVLAADTLRSLSRQTLDPLMAAVQAASVPVFLLDMWDEGGDYTADTLAHLGIEQAAGCFKREMLACADYGPNTFPLPFAFPDGRIPEALDEVRTVPVFWAGKRACGLRSLYLDHLEQRFGWDFSRTYAPDEYALRIRRARIGLSFFGLGFDTVRYWELPACGCMLLSERPPIRIPHNFTDSESAVFFDDLPELEAKLEHYVAHPEEAGAIAAAGRAHLLRHHTGTVRARQLLARIAQVLGPGG